MSRFNIAKFKSKLLVDTDDLESIVETVMNRNAAKQRSFVDRQRFHHRVNFKLQFAKSR